MHWKRRLLLFCSVVGPIVPIAISVYMAFPPAEVRAQSISLVGEWRLSSSNEEGLAAPQVDDSAWPVTTLPGNPNMAYPSRQHWLRRTIEWNGSTTEPQFFILGNLRNGIADLYVNGEWMGRSESLRVEHQPDHSALSGFEIRPGALRPGKNVVALRIDWHAHVAAGLLETSMLLGPESLVRPYFMRYRTQGALFSHGALFMCLLLVVLLGAISLATADANNRRRFLAGTWLAFSVLVYGSMVTGVLEIIAPIPGRWWVALAMFVMLVMMDGILVYGESEFLGRFTRWQPITRACSTVLVIMTMVDSRAAQLVMLYTGAIVGYLFVNVTRGLLRKREPSVVLVGSALYGLSVIGTVSLASNFGLIDWPDTFPQALATFGIVASTTLVVEFIAISKTNQLLSASLQVTNADLASALSKAQESTRVKSELLASVSHELRTPLNAIVNIPEGLLEDFPTTRRCKQCHAAVSAGVGGLCSTCGARGAENVVDQVDYIGSPADTARYLKRVCGSGRHLLSVVNDILDYSRINAGRFPLTLDTVEIPSLLESLKESIEPMAREKGLSLECATMAPSDVLRGDVVRLRQVLINLVGNAIKFSEAGTKIEITVKDEGPLWCFSVKDQGIGIAEEHQKTIFESFRQVDGGSTRRFGGTGLGLSIAKELVGMHDGTLSVQSTLGQGSTFSFRVPKAGPAPRETSVHAAVNESRSILIVDDNPTTLETMKLALRPLGAVLVGTTDPRSALAMVRELRPDLVILDVLMPHVTGLDLLRSLREAEDTKNLPVLVTSALHESEHAARQLGAQWLPRPWNNAHLAQLTMELLDDPRQRRAPTLQA